ncbi:MAG TPA: multicopper oxidase family protein [Propionibacteriaceae bacterium]
MIPPSAQDQDDAERPADSAAGSSPASATDAPRRLTRRTVLGLGAAAAAVTAAGIIVPRLFANARIVAPTDPAVAATEQARHHTGRFVTRSLRAEPVVLDLGGREVRSWAYGGRLPGAPIRVGVGDELRVNLSSDLPAPTTIHWHGLALRNDMDGVPGLTTPQVEAGQVFEYAFTVPHPGTYWFHPHVGVQLDTGLYGALIVDDPNEPGAYDDEAVVVLDDWTDGWGESPDQLLERARRDGMGGMHGMGGMGGMGMGMPSVEQPLGPDTGEVRYPAHLINGRLPAAPYAITTSPGRRVRLRIINAGSDTAYRFAIGGHRLTVTHADGFPVEPVDVETLIIGMGERYDVVVTAGNGVFPIVAIPEGKPDPAAQALLRTSSGAGPADTRPAELGGRLLAYRDLIASPRAALATRKPDRQLKMTLTVADGGRRWLINGRSYDDHEPLPVNAGERVRLVITNQSMMFHPMHLHGHTFALVRPDGRGIRKDTVNVLPTQQLAVDLDADNPGQWLTHCHNVYHMELGMMTTLSYRT